MTYKRLKALLLKRFNIPKEKEIRKAIRSFTIAEKSVFFFFVSIFVFSGLALALSASNSYLEEVPVVGGTLVEGVIGNPRFINPVLALSEADKNLTSLVYSGLVRVTPENNVENELAGSVEMAPDGLSYTAVLKPGVTFHDGEEVTAEDIIFTIQKITDPQIKSPRRGNWEGVEVERIDDSTVRFILPKAYAPFIENLSLGILPRHIWKNVTPDEFSFSQFNTIPIGAGPYRVESAERNSGGIPDYYRLSPFENFSGQAPFINKLIFRFYPSEDALLEAYQRGDIESLGGVSPDKAFLLDLESGRVVASPLPRVFAVFFNQSQSKALLDKTVRLALDLATPKEEIVEKILGGYGTAIDGPLPAGIFDWTSQRQATSSEARFQSAKALLTKAGWKPNADGILEKKSGSATITLSFSISTGDAPELKAVAEEVALAWQKLGAKVDVLVFETGDLNQNVIRPRKFEALLFGEVIGRGADLYPFWHSSQRNDPGLNIALYTNGRADKLLEEARSASDEDIIESRYKSFADEIRADMPAVFLYTPSFIYILPEKVRAVSLGALSAPQDRFLGTRDWYIDTDKVWKIFTNS